MSVNERLPDAYKFEKMPGQSQSTLLSLNSKYYVYKSTASTAEFPCQDRSIFRVSFGILIYAIFTSTFTLFITSTSI
jgi:hypothetical protein